MKNTFMKYYSISTSNIDKRIVLLSDIHYCNDKEKSYLTVLLDQLKEMQYDYLCISGDLLDTGKVEDTDWILDWLESLGKLSKVIIGIGNHEQSSDAVKHDYAFDKRLYTKMNKLKNVHVLDNDTYVDGNIRFIGVTLPLSYYYDYKESFSYFIKFMNNMFPEAYSNKFNILLCHTPLPFLNKKVISEVPFLRGISLVLCGHMHGGLLPVPLWRLGNGRGVIGPFHTVFPKGAYGVFKRDGLIIIVSSGITKISQVHKLSFLNFLFRKEITNISLETKK